MASTSVAVAVYTVPVAFSAKLAVAPLVITGASLTLVTGLSGINCACGVTKFENGLDVGVTASAARPSVVGVLGGAFGDVLAGGAATGVPAGTRGPRGPPPPPMGP